MGAGINCFFFACSGTHRVSTYIYTFSSFSSSPRSSHFLCFNSSSPLPNPTIMSQHQRPITNNNVVQHSPIFDYHRLDQQLLDTVAYDALVWSSLHGLLVGDKSVQSSGTVPGVGLVHAPLALLPTPFSETHWRRASDLAPIFNELVDRVSLDATFIHESLSRTKRADEFTSRLLDIHSKMLEINKKEEIRLGLHRSDYMLDEKTKSLLQIELNTISSSFAGLSNLVTELHRYILSHHGKRVGLDSERVPTNNAVYHFADALAKAWSEYNNPRAAIMFVVQAEERNMYDQHFISASRLLYLYNCAICDIKGYRGLFYLKKTIVVLNSVHTRVVIILNFITRIILQLYEKHWQKLIGKEKFYQMEHLLCMDGQAISVVYFRAGYTPVDYPSESEWRARLLMEQSSAIKCPSISYHLVGTKKIQQELAKPGVLERFLEDKDDIAKLRNCFAGLWSLDDPNIVQKAIETPELFVMKPQREGGGNNIYGDDVRETLLKLQKAGSQEDAAYILMQRIFPSLSEAILMRNGCWYKDYAISELGIFGTYLRNKDKVVMNNQSGYLMRTKISSSDEGGVAAGFAVLDSIYLT
ncbi:hypothetical protein RJT34_19065 [Clitoria ternatea]|uniref:Glutathione synthetase n=1 Tax=Clitoria ternatea TaxID=43366 RepID=A0AAN9IQC2_CLITE